MSRQIQRLSAGFTLIELLVVISIIGLLVAILLPALAKARQAANNIICLTNMRQIGTGLGMYQANNKGYLTPLNLRTYSGGAYSGILRYWEQPIDDILLASNRSRSNRELYSSVWACPINNPDGYAFLRHPTGKKYASSWSPDAWLTAYTGYVLNGEMSFYYNKFRAAGTGRFAMCFRSDDIRHPSDIVHIAEYSNETATGVSRLGPVDQITWSNYVNNAGGIAKVGAMVRHNQGGDFLFVDGHAAMHRQIDSPVYDQTLYTYYNATTWHRRWSQPTDQTWFDIPG